MFRALVVALVLIGVTVMPDGVFKRPHPYFWRVMLMANLMYDVLLVYLLFQTPEDVRDMFKQIDPELSKPLNMKSYDEDCTIYDINQPDDPWHNIKDNFDLYIWAHFFGWWTKTVIWRDWRVTLVHSALFELMEYTLQHQLPHLRECWWDHWVIDFLVVNGLGIWLGTKTMEYLGLEKHDWRFWRDVPKYRGNIKYILSEGNLSMLDDFSWWPHPGLMQLFIFICGALSTHMFMELNFFYMKAILWLPNNHPLVICFMSSRLICGFVGIEETYHFINKRNRTYRDMGYQSWCCVFLTLMEFILFALYDWELVSKLPPSNIILAWTIAIIILTAWIIWHFYIRPILGHIECKIERNRICLHNNNEYYLLDQKHKYFIKHDNKG